MTLRTEKLFSLKAETSKPLTHADITLYNGNKSAGEVIRYYNGKYGAYLNESEIGVYDFQDDAIEQLWLNRYLSV